MSAANLDVRRIAGALGAEVLGVDLSRPLDDETVARIRQAFLDHLVIFFRDQHLSPAEFEAFAFRLGRSDPHHVIQGMDGHPDILEIVREEGDRKIFASGWHADVTWQQKPVMAGILYALETPDYGGDTIFSNQYLAYETLSAGMRRMLDRLVAVHSPARVYGADAERWTYVKAMMVGREEAARVETEHPVARTHPETGRKALFVNDHYALRLKDMTAEESEPILGFLHGHAIRPEFTCRFRWRTGSIAFWDNRCVLHTPIDDYFGKRRRLWRITLEGDRPV